MSIKFNCPHCQKVLVVKEEFAGRRAPCPACKTKITVPAPVAKPVDIEEVAAAALADAPVPAAPAPKQSKIEFTCPFCNEKVSVEAELAGKRTPCPECRRIVKVPAPEDDKPKDWRQIDTRRPSAARPEAGEVPEGTWSTRDAGAVSAESLIEADAVPQLKRRLTWQQWVRRSLVAAVVVVVVAVGVSLASRSLDEYRKSQILTRVLRARDNPSSLGPAAEAELNRAAGDYYLGENNAEEARNHYQRARAAAQRGEGIAATERDLLLIDILLSQAELGGDRGDVVNGTRLEWNNVQNEIRQTAQHLRAPEARVIALRALTRVFAAKGLQAPTPLASQFAEDTSTLLPAIGLELLRANNNVAAELLVKQAQAQLPKPAEKQADKPDDKPQASPPPAQLLALLVALRKDAEANALAPLAGGNVEPDAPTSVLVGYVEGWAQRGEIAKAREQAKAARYPIDRLAALLAIAEVRIEGGQIEGVRWDLEECLTLATRELKGKVNSPWMLYRLIRASARTGLGDKALEAARLINDDGLRGRSKLEVFRQRLAETESSADASLLDTVKNEAPADGLALESFARHNTRLAGYKSVEEFVAGSEPANERPLGDIGIALGLQDKRK
jgi:transcription elongation factor Elf1